MDLPDRLARVGVEHFAGQNPGAFYSEAANLSAGVGLVYSAIPYAEFDADENAFNIIEGPAVILTHECDIDQNNKRHFNDRAIICPIIRLEAFAELKQDQGQEAHAESLVKDAAANKISRVFFLPRPPRPLGNR